MPRNGAERELRYRRWVGRLTVSLALLLIAGACARTPSAGEATPNTAASIPAVSSSAVTSAPAEQSSSAATAAPLVVIWFENRSYGQIIGNPCCPYINARASGGRRYVNYHAVTHPSLPNYLAFAGGSTCGKSSDGVLPYCTGRNLWDQLARAGIGWRVLQEARPSR